MCKKKLRGMERQCLNCRTDVSLLVDYVEDLREGLKQAKELTVRGELGDAVWKYLEVLEVDPDNAVARRQVGKVATAVRQFDQTAPGRRWRKKLHNQERFRRWLARWNEGEAGGWLSLLLWLLLMLGVFFLGYGFGNGTLRLPSPPPEATQSETK
jgi:hypothetical protein